MCAGFKHSGAPTPLYPPPDIPGATGHTTKVDT